MHKTLMLPLLLALYGTTAQAASFSKQLPLGNGGRVNISNPTGSVTITTWDRREVDVQADLGSDAQRVDVVAAGNGVDIKTVLRRGDRPEGRVHLRIRVPADAQVEANSISASLDASGVRGRLRLKSISGSIRSDKAGGDMEATSVSGRIQVIGGNPRARVRASSVSGAVSIEQGAGDLDVHSTSGRLDLELADADHVDASSISGAIVLRGAVGNRANVELESVSGRVNVALSAPAFRFEVSSYSGRVSSCFGGEALRSSSRGSRVEGMRGNGGGLVVARSHSGSVEVCDR
jgi:DUF4097 and DUF4098 domain-containing protein YvlB